MCVGFVMCGVYVCGFCNVWCVYVCGFCNVWVCVCVCFVMCGCVYVCGFCNVWCVYVCGFRNLWFVLVICVPVFTVLYCFIVSFTYIYSYLFCLY